MKRIWTFNGERQADFEKRLADLEAQYNNAVNENNVKLAKDLAVKIRDLKRMAASEKIDLDTEA